MIKKLIIACLLLMASASAFSGGWAWDREKGCKAWNGSYRGNDSIKWSGTCSGNYIHGKGILQWYRDGELFKTTTGNFNEGIAFGQAIITWPNGSRYEGELYDGLITGFGTLTYTNDIAGINIWKGRGLGKWIGNKYVVQGIFDDGNIVHSCSSLNECKKKEQSAYTQREINNTAVCKKLYPGKPVTIKYGQGTYLWPSYAKAVIIGVSDTVASARVIGGDTYESAGYGINSVHEHSCIDFQ